MKFLPLFFHVYCEADKMIERYWLTLGKGRGICKGLVCSVF